MIRPLAVALVLIAIVAASGCATPKATPVSTPSPTPTATPTASAAPTPAAAPLALTVAKPAPTRNETVTLRGTLGRAARLSVGPAGLDALAGPWSLEVPVKLGETALLVRADDGKATANATVVATRLASATFVVKYTMAVPQHSSSNDTVWYDPDGLASLPMYNGTSAKHPPHANVHDVMVTWTKQTGTPVGYGAPGSFGFSVQSIDGVGQPLSSEAPPYWGYKLNGQTAGLGITDQTVQPGDSITWEYLDGS